MGKIKKYIHIINLLLMSIRKGTPGVNRADYLKKHSLLQSIGEGCYWHPYKIPADPKFVKLHNNVVVCTNVDFITHDVSWRMLSNNPRYMEANKCRNLFYGTIEVFDHVMIGVNSLILPGVKIGPNAIVGAGSVVADDVPEGVIVAGNPARVIGYVDDYANKKNLLCSCKPYDGSISDESEICDYLWEHKNSR